MTWRWVGLRIWGQRNGVARLFPRQVDLHADGRRRWPAAQRCISGHPRGRRLPGGVSRAERWRVRRRLDSLWLRIQRGRLKRLRLRRLGGRGLFWGCFEAPPAIGSGRSWDRLWDRANKAGRSWKRIATGVQSAGNPGRQGARAPRVLGLAPRRSAGEGRGLWGNSFSLLRVPPSRGGARSPEARESGALSSGECNGEVRRREFGNSELPRMVSHVDGGRTRMNHAHLQPARWLEWTTNRMPAARIGWKRWRPVISRWHPN